MTRSSRAGQALVAAGLAALTLMSAAAPALAAPAEVTLKSGSLDLPGHDLNICGWPATFTGTGQFHFEEVVVSGADPRFVQSHVHETVNYTLVIDDDPSVPEALRGATWRGHLEDTIVVGGSLVDGRFRLTIVNTFAEGPFRGLKLQTTLVIAADGTVQVERDDVGGQIDCDALTA